MTITAVNAGKDVVIWKGRQEQCPGSACGFMITTGEPGQIFRD